MENGSFLRFVRANLGLLRELRHKIEIPFASGKPGLAVQLPPRRTLNIHIRSGVAENRTLFLEYL